MEQRDIDDIKNKLNIVDIISGYIPLTKAGRNYKGVCPFHSEKTPSFMVSQELQIFKCFGCGKGGNIFNFVQEIEGMDFVSAAKYLADKAGVKIDLKQKVEGIGKDRKELILEVNHLASEFYHFLLTSHKLGEHALKYLTEERKLTSKTIEDFKIGYAPNSWRSLSAFLLSKKYRIEDIIASGLAIPKDSGDGYYDRFRGRVTFPFKDLSGNVLGFSGRIMGLEEPKYLNTPETEVFHKGKLLFGLDKAKVTIKREGLAIVVEGQMDVISGHQGGFTNVVGSSGTSLTLDQLTVLKKFTSDLAFCFDSDLAGMEASNRGISLAESLGFNLKVIALPAPFKDLDECVGKDPEAFRKAIENAGSIYDFYFISAFSKNNQTDPLGKKKIVDYLAPILGSIKSQVLREHYVKKLAFKLEVSEESIVGNSKKSVETDGRIEGSFRYQSSSIKSGSSYNSTKSLQGVSLQEYILSLILKAPLDLAASSLYKLGQRDFTDSGLETIFVELKEHILGRKKKFEIKYFCTKLSKIDQDLAKRVEALYLTDFEDPAKAAESLEDSNFKEEVSVSLRRIKMESAKRELKNLSNKIKEAESLGNMTEVKRLSEEFKNISERLL